MLSYLAVIFLSSPHKWHTMLLSTALFQPTFLKLFTMYAFTTIHGITSHYKGMCIIYLSVLVFYCKRIVVWRQLDVIHYKQALIVDVVFGVVSCTWKVSVLVISELLLKCNFSRADMVPQTSQWRNPLSAVKS